MSLISWIVSKSKIAPLRYISYFVIVFILEMLFVLFVSFSKNSSFSWIKLPIFWSALFWFSLVVGASLGFFVETIVKLCIRTSILKKIVRITFFILLLVAHHVIFLYANIEVPEIYVLLLPVLNGMGLPPNLAFGALMHLFHLIKFPIIYYLIIASEALWAKLKPNREKEKSDAS